MTQSYHRSGSDCGKTEFVLVQHPMILLIHKDRGEPVVGERVAPWGAPDMKEYAQRVRRNLQAMQDYPDLCLNYEFSAAELEILAQEAPDVVAPMRKLVAEKRLGFLGGDYSQPHGQLFSGELNFRQLEYGLRVFKEIVGYTVTNNYHQETCLHDQMPQLLKAFGFRTATPPAFAHTITPLPGLGTPRLVAAAYRSYGPLASDCLALWRGLDGAELPLLVAAVNTCGYYDDYVRHEEHRGLWRSCELVIHAPDMAEITQERYNFMKSRGPTVLLDEAIERRLSDQKPAWKARLHTYWSYAEGEWAEAMCRQTRQTEALLLAEEAHFSLRRKPLRPDYDSDWKTVLASMHHDVHWIEVTDLKRQYLQEMDEVKKRSRGALAGAAGAADSALVAGKGISVLNTLPYARTEVASFTISESTPVRVIGLDGTACPTQCIPRREGDGLEVLFVAHVPSLGVTGYRLAPDNGTLSKGEPCERVRTHAGESVFEIAKDGTVLEASIAGQNVLAAPGHDLHYLGDKGEIIGGPGRAGRMLRFQGEVGDVVRVRAPVGSVGAEIEFLAARTARRLDITTTLGFHDHAIGVMWQDWTKLNAYWPVRGREIRYDIPYGVVTGEERVPLYAPSWLSVTGAQGGLAVFNAGVPKHYVENGRIGCVWAWGGRTFSNRMNVGWADRKQYDLTLNGSHTIRSAVMALAAAGNESQIAREAQFFNSPLLVFACADSVEAAAGDAVDLSRTDIIATAVMRRDDVMCIRFFEAAGREHSVSDVAAAIGRSIRVTDLEGTPLKTIPPYRIGYLLVQ